MSLQIRTEHKYNLLVQIDALLSLITAVLVGMWIEGGLPIYAPLISLVASLGLGTYTVKMWARTMREITKEKDVIHS